MKLFLIRHGTAQDDALTNIGVEQALKMALWLKERDHNASVIYHSSKVRSVQTSVVFKKHLDLPMKIFEELEPESSVEPLIDHLEDKNLIIVGHMPYLSRLATRLLCEQDQFPFIQFKNVAILCLDNSSGLWTLEFYVTPDQIP